MLFNSNAFLFAFLPLSLLGFQLCARHGRTLAASWLVLASLVFYACWDPPFVLLLLGSIGFNFAVSERIGAAEPRPAHQRAWLILGISANIALLVFCKYLAGLLHFAIGTGLLHMTVPDIVLPLGISFFTFTQIGYLVDVHQGAAKDRGLLNYVLFVTFFPHLIAGPILHNREIMPQFADPATYRISSENIAIGLSIFVIGLVKKCVLADPLAAGIAVSFGDAQHLQLLAAWDAALAYSLQLYFDFSGYSDMAIGIARMFNVRFPLNFNSPFKAASIIDYWQRWHMTLTRYLGLYLYNPIGMAVMRRRTARGLEVTRQAQATPRGFATMVAFPTFVTMGIAGVWHGAGLQYLLFGLLHAAYLTVNHAWRILCPRHGTAPAASPWQHAGNVLLTFLAVLAALVVFRADSVGTALHMFTGMLGAHGFGTIPVPARIIGWASIAFLAPASTGDATFSWLHAAWLICLFAVVWTLPNTQEVMYRVAPALGRIKPGPMPSLTWQPTRGWAVAMGCAATLAVLAIGGTTEFLYFQF